MVRRAACKVRIVRGSASGRITVSAYRGRLLEEYVEFPYGHRPTLSEIRRAKKTVLKACRKAVR